MLTSVLPATINVSSQLVLIVKIPQDRTTAPVGMDISGMALHARVCYLTLAFCKTCFYHLSVERR